MTLEVKERISQIRRGEVPEGYKKGKLGIVPLEWKDTPFSTLFASTSDYTDDLEHYPLYSLTIENGITAKTERYERSHLVKKENSYKIVRPNDYAYNPMNIRFGAVARHKGSIPVAVSGYYDIFTTVNDSDLAFMDSFLTCGPMITYYNKVSTGSLIEKQRVHFSQFMEFSLPLPSAEERQKIAEILTMQDKVIELKEKLIADKQRQKKYLMQQLLTGKMRCEHCKSQWVHKKLKDVCYFSTKRSNGLSMSYVSTENMLPDLQNGVKFDINENTVTGITYKTDDILMANIRPYLKKVWKADKSGTCSSDVLVFRSSAILPNYLFYIIANDDFLAYVMEGAKGSKMPRGDKKQIMDYDICVPSLLNEQYLIAHILSTADREIELFQQELEQEKQKKKSLMQLLLTGIVRV